MVRMGCVRGKGGVYMGVHTVASTYVSVSVAKQGYSSSQFGIRVVKSHVISKHWGGSCMGTWHSAEAARDGRIE